MIWPRLSEQRPAYRELGTCQNCGGRSDWHGEIANHDQLERVREARREAV